MENFYFAYGYNKKNSIATRLCKFENYLFEQYDFEKNKWESAPHLACIFIGEDAMYDDITKEEADKLILKMNEKASTN